MKAITKLTVAAALFSVFQCAAYAQSVPEIAADTHGGWTAQVDVAESGYYDITAECKNDSVEASCYLYGESNDATRAATVIPKTVYYSNGNESYASEDGYVTVSVRGVYVEDGKLDIGLYTDGASDVYTKNVNVTKADGPYEFLNGGDITEYSYIKSLGGKYSDLSGNEVDAIDYLAQSGMNAARIRLSNNPGKGRGDGTYYLPEGFQDEEDCLLLARKAKENGMKIVFTFNYSDYWSNGERQIIPSDWVAQIKDELGYDVKDPAFLNSMSAEQKTQIQNNLSEIIYDYTYDYMTRLKEQGTLPEYVSLGNEINGGILFPFGNTFDANMNKDRFELVYDNNIDEANDIKCYEDWAGLAKMLNAGYDAVKAVSPDSQVIIHIANGSKDSVFTWFFDKYKNAGGKFDVIGASYYPFWSWNKIDVCKTFCDNISARYDKDIMIMETGFNFSPTKKDGSNGQLTPTTDDWIYKDIYPDTQSGHKAYMADLVNSMKQTRCLGILYWDPIMIHVEDPENPNQSLSGWAYRESDDKPDGNVVENTTLFDFDGHAIKTLEFYQDTKNSVKIDKTLNVGNISMTRGENGITAKVSITNNTDAASSVTAFISCYSEDGRLTGVVQKSENIEPQESKNIELFADMTDKAKMYLWNNENLMPLIPAQEEAQ